MNVDALGNKIVIGEYYFAYVENDLFYKTIIGKAIKNTSNTNTILDILCYEIVFWGDFGSHTYKKPERILRRSYKSSNLGLVKTHKFYTQILNNYL